MSKHHTSILIFRQLLDDLRLPQPMEEYRFHQTRKRRFDLAWPRHRVASRPARSSTWRAGRIGVARSKRCTASGGQVVRFASVFSGIGHMPVDQPVEWPRVRLRINKCVILRQPNELPKRHVMVVNSPIRVWLLGMHPADPRRTRCSLWWPSRPADRGVVV